MLCKSGTGKSFRYFLPPCSHSHPSTLTMICCTTSNVDSLSRNWWCWYFKIFYWTILLHGCWYGMVRYVTGICTPSYQKSAWLYRASHRVSAYLLCLLSLRLQAYNWTLRPNVRRSMGVFSWIWTERCQMGYAILINLLSLTGSSQFLNSYWLSRYVHWVAA